MPNTKPLEALAQWEEMREAFAPVHDRISEDLPFGLDLIQYADDGSYDKDIQRVKPRSQSIFRLWRYKLGVALKRAPIHITAEPIDEVDDPESAEWMKRALEWELFGDRAKNFKHARMVYMGGALAARAWAARWDLNLTRGKFPMIDCVPVDVRNLLFTPGYLSPHDNECPVLIEQFRMPVRAAQGKRGWKNTELLKPDAGSAGQGVFRQGVFDQAGNYSTQDGGSDDIVDTSNVAGFFTGLKVWFRHEHVKQEMSYRELAPEQRFMECLSCGMKSPTQGQLEGELPEFSSLSCPTCAGDMERQDGIKTERESKRCLILAPYSAREKLLWDGPWPFKCSTFPYLWLPAYIVPHKTIGPSDISLNRTVVLGQNLTLRETYEQVMLSRPRYLLPKQGLENAAGTRFDLSGPDASIFYTTDFPPDGVNVIQALPVNQALFGLHRMLEGEFRANEGSSDVAIGPEQSRDIAAKSLELQIETGNVPIDLFVETLYDAESQFFTTLSEIIVDTYTAGKVIRYRGEDGIMAWQRLFSSDMVACDVSVSAGPSLDNIRQEHINTFQALVAMPPQYRRSYAKFAKMDRSIVEEIEREEQRVAAEQEQQIMDQQQQDAEAMGGFPAQPAAVMNGGGF